MIVSEKLIAQLETQKIFDSYLSEYTQELNYSIVVSHFGDFSQDLIHSLAAGVENAMISFGDQIHINKRMFSILIEGMQNARIHGGEDENGEKTACLIVAKSEKNYKILLGNIVDKEDRSALKMYLGNINNHDANELKALYLKVLKEGYFLKKGSSGLGVISMRLKSSNDLKYRLYNLTTGKTFFVVEVELDR